MRHGLIPALLGLAILAGWPASTATAQELSQTPLTVAYGNGLVIPVYVNDQGPFDFLVDTAASNTVLFEKMVSALDIPMDQASEANVVFGLREQLMDVHELSTVRVAGFERAGIRTIIAPDWDPTRDGSPDGLLGMDFLQDYFVMFDLVENVFFIGKTKPRRLPGVWTSARLRGTDFDILRSKLFLTSVRLHDRNFFGLVDTGASNSFIDRRSARILGVKSPVVGADRGALEDVSGTRKTIFLVEVSRVSIGRKSWRRRIFSVQDLRIFRYLRQERTNVAILGMDVLGEQSFALDFPRNQLFIRRDQPARE